MEIMKVMNNCHIITVDRKDTIVSYTSPILEISKGEVTKVYNKWDYSKTTLKHLNAALRKLGLDEIANMPRNKKEEYFQSEGLI